jgi:hypothetical protein
MIRKDQFKNYPTLYEPFIWFPGRLETACLFTVSDLALAKVDIIRLSYSAGGFTLFDIHSKCCFLWLVYQIRCRFF